MVTRKVGPALAAGYTVVMKIPADTPLTAAAMAVLGERASVPPGVFNIITAHKNTVEIGHALTESPVMRKVFFMGSTGVGKILMKQSADTLKKLSFEIGGNVPFIVFDVADLDAAVEGAVACKFRSSGQTCICSNRIQVQRDIYEKFTKAFVEKVSRFVLGPGSQSGVTHGPLIHSQAMQKAQEHTEDAVQKGGKVLLGGHARPELGPNFEHTVISNATAAMKIAHEETFGPVAPIFPFDTEAEVLERANDTDVGLVWYFYSRDISRCYRVAEAVEVGMVGINIGLVSDRAMPFGGMKESGFGREGSS